MPAIKSSLQPELLQLNNISWQTMVNWMFTILPIWFIGMTLYQRIYASKNTQTAQRGWFIAGLFEYPLMAFTGVILGLLARVAFENNMLAGYDASTMDPEMGLPLLLKTMLPVGFLGIVLSAYFSAIMSTADSCLMASSGNVLTDVFKFAGKARSNLLVSQFITLVLGAVALLLALKMTNVLDLMLHSYSFMVSGLIVPVLAGLFVQQPKPVAALLAMLSGGGITIVLTTINLQLPLGLDPIIYGIIFSFLVFIATSVLSNPKRKTLSG
jgi:SSS family solute:Na+ symporter